MRNTTNAFNPASFRHRDRFDALFCARHSLDESGCKKGLWSKYLGRSLSECTLGGGGVGNIGKAVIRRARGFWYEIRGSDINHHRTRFLLENGVEMTSLEDLLGRGGFHHSEL